MQFFADLPNYAFLQFALITGVLAAVASGVVGTYVVTRRVTSIAGAISHCVLGGLGAAVFAQKALSWTWVHPLLGAGLVAVGSALLIGVLNLRAREREDTVIGAIWAIGMAIGILFLARTPGYNQDLMSYLFG
ncbi:MAG: metal ABC transporter permease, partial [Deltaproteobacteria bacterium]|nr:metal ABC transporter permease [Deltaproteobacteria bacterium]